MAVGKGGVTDCWEVRNSRAQQSHPLGSHTFWEALDFSSFKY